MAELSPPGRVCGPWMSAPQIPLPPALPREMGRETEGIFSTTGTAVEGARMGVREAEWDRGQERTKVARETSRDTKSETGRVRGRSEGRRVF